MKTATQTRGLANGYNVHRKPTPRKQGRSASSFLSQPCSRFEMPKERSNRTAGTRTVARQKRSTRSDETIIARRSMPKRIAFYAVAVLTMSGILPMALAALQIWLTDVYGILAFLACMGADAAFIYWMVRHA